MAFMCLFSEVFPANVRVTRRGVHTEAQPTLEGQAYGARDPSEIVKEIGYQTVMLLTHE